MRILLLGFRRRAGLVSWPIPPWSPPTTSNTTLYLPLATTNTTLPPPSMNVQAMLTNWFWPSKATTSTANNTTSTMKHNAKSLNIAPLGHKKAAANTTMHASTPIADRKHISSPTSNFFQLNEAVSPYAELVSGGNSPVPTSSGNNSGSNGNSGSSVNVSGSASGKSAVTPPRKNRDVSPQRVSTSVQNANNAFTVANATSKKRTPVKSGTPVHTPTHTPIQSPFSYVEQPHTNNTTDNTNNYSGVCKENEMILANLPTEQLHQLLLLQAAHAGTSAKTGMQVVQSSAQDVTPPRARQGSAGITTP
eukprot:Colp12_sorted_trinity150504_noHs@18921